MIIELIIKGDFNMLMCAVFTQTLLSWLYMLVSFACPRVCLSSCVCRAVGCADLMTLDTMTPQERKRQGYIHELIQTEETYVDDLELVLEVQTNTQAYSESIQLFFRVWTTGIVYSVSLFFPQVFHKPMSESGRLTEAEMGMIFVNWRELIMCNTKLLK